MFKYYNILDNSNNKIVFENADKNDYINITYDLPIEVVFKYEELLKELRTILHTFDMLTEETIYNSLIGKTKINDILDLMNYYNTINLHRNDDSFNDNYYFVDDINTLSSMSNHTFECYLDDMLAIIKILAQVFSSSYDYYKKVYDDTKRAYEEIRMKNKIVLSDKDLIIDIPNAWYLTRNGTLYNSMGENGHKESNLEYPIMDIRKGFIYPDKELYNSMIEKYHEEFDDVKEKGYITDSQFVDYLNLYVRKHTVYKDRIYHKMIVDLTLGIIKAHEDLYRAFKRLLETDVYEKSLNKIFKLTSDSNGKLLLDDLLIRFVGMSKVKAGGLPFICTSNTYERDFQEYKDHGYKIDLVDPIDVVNGEVKEINLDGHKLIKKLLNK